MSNFNQVDFDGKRHMLAQIDWEAEFWGLACFNIILSNYCRNFTPLAWMVRVQFVTPSFHPNLIRNMFSMPKCLHSYNLLTWFHQNKYPFNVNTLNASKCNTYYDTTPLNEMS